MEKMIGDEFRKHFHTTFPELVSELQSSKGETSGEKLESFLAERGWDIRLEELRDAPLLHDMVLKALEKLALRREKGDTAPEIENARRKKDMERAAASGHYGSLFDDQYVGFTSDELADKLPCEQYWVPSLAAWIPRTELARNLAAVAELRKVAAAELFKIQQTALPYQHELAIFDEMLRQGLPGLGGADTRRGSVPA